MGKATGKINLETFSDLKSPTQYFWFNSDTSVVGQGAHITNISEPAFRSSAAQWETTPTNGDYNLLLNTNGIKLRNGKLDLMSLSGTSLNFYTISGNQSYDVAQFGTSARIGQTSGSHFTFSQYAIQALDGSGNVKLSLSPDGLSFGSHTAAKQSDLTTEINQRKAIYAISSTSGGSKDKTTGSTPSGFVLYTGATVTVIFNNANTAAAPTLSVNGTTATEIKSYTGVSLTEAEYKWEAGAAITFTYDGSNWRMQDGGALQAKADAAASATIADNRAGVASTKATEASGYATQASGYADDASGYASTANGAKAAAQQAEINAESARDLAEGYKDVANGAKNAAVEAKGQAETFAGNALQSKNEAAQSATAASNSATASAEVMGGFTILWNYSSFTQAAQAQFYICGFDPVSGTASNSDGWVKWNDSRVTLPKININPAYYGNFIPYYIPIFIVFNTTSPNSGYSLVWFNELTKSWVYPVANADPQSQEEIPWLHSTWSWNSNHIILGRFSGVKQTLIENDGSESFNNYLSEYEIFKPPRSYKQISNANISNSSLLEELNTLQSGTPRWQYTNNGVVYDVFFDSESSSSDSASSLSGGYYYIDSNGARQNIAFSSLDTTTETIEEDGEIRTIQVPIVYFDNGLSPLQSQVSDLEGTSDDLNNRVSTLENAIEINPNPDDGQPYILIRSPEETVTNPTGTTSDEPAEEEIQYASTRFTPDRISFLKGDDEVLYISSRDEAGLIDINSANIHNFIRIGQMEIFTASDNGIAIRKGIEDEEE